MNSCERDGVREMVRFYLGITARNGFVKRFKANQYLAGSGAGRYQGICRWLTELWKAASIRNNSRRGRVISVKTKTFYTCQNCGYQSAKWLGKCPDCNSWNTLAEEIAPKTGPTAAAAMSASAPLPISEVTGEAEQRLSCGISELD